MAIIRILIWMSSVCDDNTILITRAIPRLDHCNWTSDPHKAIPSIYVCNYYQKVILDNVEIIIIQIKKVVKRSNRGNL